MPRLGVNMLISMQLNQTRVRHFPHPEGAFDPA